MANFNLNKVILGGRVVADPELKQTPAGVPVVSFRIAVNRRFQSKNADAQSQPQADFLNITAWRQQAEFVARYFRKGSSICVVGSIQTRSWTDPQGQKQYATDIVADEIYFVDSKSEAGGYGNAPAGQYTPESYGTPAYSSGAATTPKFEEISGDDDLPF